MLNAKIFTACAVMIVAFVVAVLLSSYIGVFINDPFEQHKLLVPLTIVTNLAFLVSTLALGTVVITLIKQNEKSPK